MNNFSSSSNLPNPKLLFWAHSTCSKDELSAALTNLNITAIEADIVMGYEQNDINEVSPIVQPVMAHPPQYLSDLTFGTFIEMATTTGPHSKDFQQKHLKLDFKEIATVRPVLESLHQVFCKSDDSFDQMVFLNADILAGPGKRYGKLEMEADIFIKECLGFAQKSEKHRSQCAFSLGWRVDCRSLGGVVLAVNARVLAKALSPFDSILNDYPHIHLLAWTGTGEPPISMHQVSSQYGNIIQYFYQNIIDSAANSKDCIFSRYRMVIKRFHPSEMSKGRNDNNKKR
eukprot:scaffold10534_cov246-Chaetoceros_neogracile.AAC.9